jgi:hypothetical protein
MPALPRRSRLPALRWVLRSRTPGRTTDFNGDGILALVFLNGELAVAGRAEAAEPSFGVAVAAPGANDIHSTSAKAMSRILPHRELTRMVNEKSDEVVGFGPIEFLLKDPDVTEVAANGPDVSLHP